eukprot:380199_1
MNSNPGCTQSPIPCRSELLDSAISTFNEVWAASSTSPDTASAQESLLKLLRPDTSLAKPSSVECRSIQHRHARELLKQIMKVMCEIFNDDRQLISNAADVLDKCHIVCCRGNPSGREVCLVQKRGGRGNPYVCLVGNRYCSCRNFFDRAKRAKQGSTVLCKHLVAVRLAPLLGLMESDVVEDSRLYAFMSPPSQVKTGTYFTG